MPLRLPSCGCPILRSRAPYYVEWWLASGSGARRDSQKGRRRRSLRFKRYRAIDGVIAALNDPVQRAGLLTGDVDSTLNFDRLIGLHGKASLFAGVLIGMNEPWAELTTPRVVSGRIRFITESVATAPALSAEQ